MRRIFEKELQQLNTDLLRMGGLVEESVEQTIIALRELDKELAQVIIRKDDLIDHMENKIEKHCLSLFALQQPLAGDLRLIGSSLKMLTDLERIADHASDIAELTIRLADYSKGSIPGSVFVMADKTLQMLRNALDSFIKQDTDMAKIVCDADDEVDELFSKVIMDRVNAIKSDSKNVEQCIDIMFIVKYFERIGDHATNIAEWVIYNVTGQHKHMQHPENHPDRERYENSGT